MKEAYLLSGFLEPTNQPYAIAKIAGIELCQSYNRQYGTRYRCVMPTNLYGPNDSYDLENSHVLPALIRKFHLARLVEEKNWNAVQKDESVFGPIPDSLRAHLGIPFGYGTDISRGGPMKSANSESPVVQLWGSGAARREFLHVDDMASATVFIMQIEDGLYDQATQNGQITHINIGTGEDITIRDLSEIVQSLTRYTGKVAWDTTQPDGMPQKRSGCFCPKPPGVETRHYAAGRTSDDISSVSENGLHFMKNANDSGKPGESHPPRRVV